MECSQIARLQEALSQEKAENESRLNRGLNFWQSYIALGNILYAQWFNTPSHHALERDTVQLANQEYTRRFPSGLAERTFQALSDPGDYRQRIKDYEQCLGHRPYMSFPTAEKWYDLIVKDPLRIQEELLCLEAALEIVLDNKRSLRILDLGTGNARMLYRISGLLSGIVPKKHLRLMGLDRDVANLLAVSRDAKRNSLDLCLQLLTADMTSIPLPANSCDFIVAASCLHLVPKYERPLIFLEILRCLRPGGELFISGPNENFSADKYVTCTVANNLETYILPWNILEVLNLGKVGTTIDALAQKRLDCGYIQTRQIYHLLSNMECTILDFQHWPEQGAEPRIYSGVRFRITSASKQYIKKYATQ